MNLRGAGQIWTRFIRDDASSAGLLTSSSPYPTPCEMLPLSLFFIVTFSFKFIKKAFADDPDVTNALLKLMAELVSNKVTSASRATDGSMTC